MNEPNLLRLVRSCAKWRGGALLVATLMACTSAGAAPKEPTLRVLAAPGDSLRIGVAWGAATRATGYRLTVAATRTNGTWTGLPANLPVTGLTSTFTAVNAVWDSVTFTATVESVDAIGPTGKTVSGQLGLRRRAGTPGPITFDTSATVVGVITRPLVVDMALGESRILCGFKVFASGAVAMRSQDAPACDSIYVRYVPAANRLVSAAEQIHEDAQCWTWSSDMPLSVPVAPLAPCSSAAQISGLALTWRQVFSPWSRAE